MDVNFAALLNLRVSVRLARAKNGTFSEEERPAFFMSRISGKKNCLGSGRYLAAYALR